jgi:hypothetical protein
MGKVHQQLHRERELPAAGVCMHIADPKERQRYRNAESKRLNILRRRSKHVSDPLATSTPQSRKSISNHLKRHLRNQTQCLWDQCRMKCSSEVELRRHLYKEHGVNVRQAPFDLNILARTRKTISFLSATKLRGSTTINGHQSPNLKY